MFCRSYRMQKNKCMGEKMINLALDRLNPLCNNFVLTARLFFTGAWCRVATFDGKGTIGHLYLLRSGQILLKNRSADSIYVDQQTLLFFQRPCPHALLLVERTEIDLVCAALVFGDRVGSSWSLALHEMVCRVFTKRVGASLSEWLVSDNPV
jgi:hypothetical protein